MPNDHVFARVTEILPDPAVRLAGRLQARLYRATGGRIGGRFAHGPVLVITTTGRKTGKQRSTTILYQAVGEDLVVVGSNTGSERDPAWALNLLAHPEADVQIGTERRHVKARLATGTERADLWATMNAMYHGYDEYRARTDREIPVFVLTAARV